MLDPGLFDPILSDWQAMLPFIAIGFVAQMIDGALGMAFGVISNTLLITMGVSPAAASAGVHTIKNFTGFVSGVAHVLHRNVDWPLFWRLLLPGMAGGLIGAWALVQVDAAVAKPVVLTYLAGVGIYLLVRGLRSAPMERRPRIVAPIGLVGGFLDAVGGGGWGPVVTSNLLLQGANPRTVVGTVNTAEFFLALTISATFLATLGPAAFTQMTLGLLIGGVAAAPFGAMVAKRVNARTLLVMVGLVLTVTSAWSLWRALGA